MTNLVAENEILEESKEQFILQNQYRDCWWSGYKKMVLTIFFRNFTASVSKVASSSRLGFKVWHFIHIVWNAIFMTSLQICYVL